MTDEEVRAVIVAAQQGRGWTNWVGSGFIIGYGSSSGGNFGILDDGTLVWGYFYDGPRIEVGVRMPVDTEIVVVTRSDFEGLQPRYEVQRFIWTNVPGVSGGWRMIEQEPAAISVAEIEFLLSK